ncbi:MAG: rod shape-determining protein [Candidatus Aenigmarchaeota archaeon]|nr:rod shape-determining protein [Candidatus Aenigmarchaeota archaeon]
MDLAIDLGTANTVIWAPNRGIVVNEPSFLALRHARNNGTTVEAFGREAKRMLGMTPEGMQVIPPMRDGVIADFELAEKMLAHFIGMARQQNYGVRPRVVIGVPSEITSVEKNAIRDTAYRAKAREVHLVYEALAAAIGAGLPVSENKGSMIIDIGGGTTDVAVIVAGDIHEKKAVKVAGNAMDDAVTQYMKRNHNLLIGEQTAERVKINAGSAYALDQEREIEIKGRHALEHLPRTVLVNTTEIREALSECVSAIISAVRLVFEKTDPELLGDISDTGIRLAGGGSLLKGFDLRLRHELDDVRVEYADDPLSAVVLGVGKLLSDPKLLAKVALS